MLEMQNAECRMQNASAARSAFCILHSAFAYASKVPKIFSVSIAVCRIESTPSSRSSAQSGRLFTLEMQNAECFRRPVCILHSAFCIRLCLHRPQDLFRVDRRLPDRIHAVEQVVGPIGEVIHAGNAECRMQNASAAPSAFRILHSAFAYASNVSK